MSQAVFISPHPDHVVHAYKNVTNGQPVDFPADNPVNTMSLRVR